MENRVLSFIMVLTQQLTFLQDTWGLKKETILIYNGIIPSNKA